MGFSNTHRLGKPAGRFLLAIIALAVMQCGTASALSNPRQNITSAKAMKSMSRVYMAAGRYDKAREYASLAVAAAVRDSEPDTMTSACMIDLAWVDLQLGNYESAWTVGQEALGLQRAAYGDEHIYVAYTLRIMASICNQRGDYRLARQTLDESLDVMYANDAGENEVAPFLVDLAGILVAEGKYDEAEQTYMDARDKVLKSFGPSHLYTATVMTHIAALYVKQGHFEEARQFIDESYPVLKEVFGDDSYALVDTWMTIASIHEHNGELSKAENMMKRALNRVEVRYGEEHPEAARILGSLGEFYLDHGNYEQAAVICPLAVQRMEASLGENHDATAMARNDLARLYLWQGRTAEASRLCSNAVMTLVQLFDPGHPSLAKVRHTLSSLLLAKAPQGLTNLN